MDILAADALQNIEYRLALGKPNCDGAEHNSVRRKHIKLCRVKVGEIVKYRCAVDRYRAVQLFARVNIRFVGLDRLGLACRHGVCAVLVLLAVRLPSERFAVLLGSGVGSTSSARMMYEKTSALILKLSVVLSPPVTDAAHSFLPSAS